MRTFLLSTQRSTMMTALAASMVLLAGLCVSQAAQARSDVSWSVNVGVPGVSVGVGDGYVSSGYVAAPVYGTYVAPPVYMPPRVVYVQPPVYYAPPPVYYAPPPVYVPAPRYYYRHGYGHGGYGRRDGYR